MQSLRPESAAAMTAHRREAVRLAKAQEKAVSDKCIRSGQEIPGYVFDELIGKGSFGRVYKGKKASDGKVVAIKVLDIDEADFQAFGDMKDEQIRDFNKEIQILRRAQESGAENLNQIIEALPVHSQLWLVCEYCPGGSVKTLMRATRDRLEERYLVVVARELAKALKGLHQAGIMHRDVKAANVLIHENGGVQLCDFGIAAAIEGQTDKRRTFVGTFHWMPPELWADKPEYNDEVDVWGYGCTLYECATGTPPNSDVRERQQLKVRMRRLKQSIGLPDKENMNFSDGLKSLVKFALNPDAASRPSMHDILQHDFLLDTEEEYPTSSLTELVQHYYAWLFGGGQRVSLFIPGGAAAASEVSDEFGATMAEEWNFSMTQDFEKRVSAILEIPDLSTFSDFELGEGEVTPRGPAPPGTSNFPSLQEPMTVTQKANFELRVERGAGLNNLFNPQQPAYEYKTKRDFVPIRESVNRTSDLPFRAMSEERPTSIASVAIDLGDFDEEDYAMAAPRTGEIKTSFATPTPKQEEPAFILPDAATIRAKRADSKEPKESSGQSLTARRASSTDSISDPTAEDWTIKQELDTPQLQDAAEITPTQPTNRPKERDTMGWSFADAMKDVSQPTSPQYAQPLSPKPQEGTPSPEQQQKAKKHATMDWSFSVAMQEVDENPQEEPANRVTPGRHSRPAPLLRTMTQPVTSYEVHEAYEDFSRPGTSMSGAYSESSASSTDFDPFALDRRTPYGEDGPGDAEFDDVDINDFYASRGRTMIPPDFNGVPPELGLTVTPHMNGLTHPAPYPAGLPARIGEEGFPGPSMIGNRSPVGPGARRSPRASSSPRSLGHIRGSGSGASRGHGSGSSIGSARTTNNNMTTSVSTSNGSGSSGTGLNGFSSRPFNLPIPVPPSLAAMAGDASPDAVQRELDRLLGEFQEALGNAADVISEGARGRARRRRDKESGSEWEDEE
ncbi:hypothetical protein H2198_001775 [Neophaeococcomyces mojaviensis]|uniref:Uncharacterized protein n=1 Tax=Neophaeococcomyces mojaviensis TaxID=3383035 RepID=A0ACC3AG57_9EURO|nr:hypothetical protein H2198_001775 [Knufia sp. JES_112]